MVLAATVAMAATVAGAAVWILLAAKCAGNGDDRGDDENSATRSKKKNKRNSKNMNDSACFSSIKNVIINEIQCRNILHTH